MSGILFFSYLAYDLIIQGDPIKNTIVFLIFALVFLSITWYVFSYIKTNIKSIVIKNIILWIFVAFASNL
ncbi:MAG: hypothetical protein P8P43_04120 [Flavobacteriaceae bacterium]|nr:hypothetical protein [Flavobacteriaceae bacterium]